MQLNDNISLYLIALIFVYATAYFLAIAAAKKFIYRLSCYILSVILGMGTFFDFFMNKTTLFNGHNRYLFAGFIYTLLFSIVLQGIKNKREKILLVIFLIIILFKTSLAHFIYPFLYKEKFENFATTINSDGICLQSTSYTCGPAAVITVLKELGIEAKESDLSIAAYTNPCDGTSADFLIKAVKNLYNVDAEYKRCSKPDKLKELLPVVAIIKFGPLVDHYVAVIKITEDKIILGDPVLGKRILTYADFNKLWRKKIILFKR